MHASEIILPETKPETEWVRGRALQKVSPPRDHARLQSRFASTLEAWCGRRGEVGTEWRFRVAPTGEVRRPLVPDLAFVSAQALHGLTREEIQVPAFAPTVAIEILSRGDRRRDIDSKIDVYMRAGTALVVIVDPDAQTVQLHDAQGTSVCGRGEVVEHAALPGFALDVAAYFDAALRLTDYEDR